MTGEQCRAARALLSWSQEELAFRAGLSVSAIGSIERGRKAPTAYNLRTLKRTFDGAGVEFTDDDPPGVRLKK